MISTLLLLKFFPSFLFFIPTSSLLCTHAPLHRVPELCAVYCVPSSITGPTSSNAWFQLELLLQGQLSVNHLLNTRSIRLDIRAWLKKIASSWTSSKCAIMAIIWSLALVV